MIGEIDGQVVRKLGLMKALTDWWAWGPVIVGVGLMAIANAWLGGVATLGWLAIIGGLGRLGWGLTRGRSDHDQVALQEIREEIAVEHRELLRDLRHQVRRDGDVRTGPLVKRIGETFDRLLEQGMFEARDDSAWHQDVRLRLLTLYEAAVVWMQRAHQLWEAQREMATEEAQGRASAERESLLSEINVTLHQLGQSLDQLKLQALQAALPEQTLTEVRAELDQAIAVARRVELRLQAFEEEVLTPSRRVND